MKGHYRDDPAYSATTFAPMIGKIFIAASVTAAAIGVAAPASADPGNPFSQLCMDSPRTTAARVTTPGSATSRVQAGIQQGCRDMQAALAPRL
jgi:hypothetical protein